MSVGDEWGTPPHIIELARDVMGVIDLDPASSAEANKIVRAKTFYNKKINGLGRKWFGNVWLNPPYSQPLITRFVNQVCLEHYTGGILSAIVLVNNSTDTAWFHTLLEHADLMVLTCGRLSFIGADGKEHRGNRQGQALFFWGCDVDYAIHAFCNIGHCIRLQGK